MAILAAIKSFFTSGAGDAVQKTFNGIGDLAKDIKTIATGKLDPETAVNLLLKVANIELEFGKLQSQVIIAEAQGNWLQRNWRPITMMVFLLLIILDSFKILPNPLAPEIWGLLMIGLGGYVVGRSAEKVVKMLKS